MSGKRRDMAAKSGKLSKIRIPTRQMPQNPELYHDILWLARTGGANATGTNHQNSEREARPEN